MKAKCSVTFEFSMRPSQTWHGEVEGSSFPTVIRRAADAAQKELQPRNWSSAVAVILERDNVVEEESTEIEDPLPFPENS
jgi:hypothetical protein